MENYLSHESESSMEAFSKHKQFIKVADWEVAHVEAGEGRSLFLLHSCPFELYERSTVKPLLEQPIEYANAIHDVFD